MKERIPEGYIKLTLPPAYLSKTTQVHPNLFVNLKLNYATPFTLSTDQLEKLRSEEQLLKDIPRIPWKFSETAEKISELPVQLNESDQKKVEEVAAKTSDNNLKNRISQQLGNMLTTTALDPPLTFDEAMALSCVAVSDPNGGAQQGGFFRFFEEPLTAMFSPIFQGPLSSVKNFATLQVTRDKDNTLKIVATSGFFSSDYHNGSPSDVPDMTYSVEFNLNIENGVVTVTRNDNPNGFAMWVDPDFHKFMLEKATEALNTKDLDHQHLLLFVPLLTDPDFFEAFIGKLADNLPSIKTCQYIQNQIKLCHPLKDENIYLLMLEKATEKLKEGKLDDQALYPFIPLLTQPVVFEAFKQQLTNNPPSIDLQDRIKLQYPLNTVADMIYLTTSKLAALGNSLGFPLIVSLATALRSWMGFDLHHPYDLIQKLPQNKEGQASKTIVENVEDQEPKEKLNQRLNALSEMPVEKKINEVAKDQIDQPHENTSNTEADHSRPKPF